MRTFVFLAFTITLFLSQSASAGKPQFTPITGFDLNKYLGKWFEIARFPHSFEKGLINVTATYALRDDGKVSVVNEGDLEKNGKHKTAKGKAKFAQTPDVGWLKVSFFLWFYGDYKIVVLDKDYQFALILSDSYDYLWILSRTPKLDQTIVDSLLVKAKELGFDLSKVYMVPQGL
jgi:apolipoprotein D and lipocalin family protein